jgi:plastocyanin
MRFGLAAGAIAAVGLLTAAGCGEKRDVTGPAAPAGPGVAPAAGAAVNVSESEFKLDPASPKVAKTGALVFKVTNAGSVPHALEIDTPTGKHRTAPIAPGKTGTLKANLKAGTYAWFCPLDHHKARGMTGQVTVGSGGGSSSGGSSTPAPAPAPSSPGGY